MYKVDRRRSQGQSHKPWPIATYMRNNDDAVLWDYLSGELNIDGVQHPRGAFDHHVGVEEVQARV